MDVRVIRGQLELFGHPTTSLEAMFLEIVAESKAHPGRRYLPPAPKSTAVSVADGAAGVDTHIKK